jgi:hypothetical protein
MGLPLKRTLGDIRSDIQIRLGFGLAGQAGVVNSPIIDSMVRSAQTQLYEQFDWLEMKAVQERVTGSGQQYYDYPDDCNIERINSIWVMWGNRLNPLIEGISNSDRGWNPGGVPQKYERRDQYEIWPIPTDNSYTLRIDYIKALGQLQNSNDRTSIPSEPVYLHALANAKAHYRQPDAQTYATQLDALLKKLRAEHRSKQEWGKQRTVGLYDYVSSDQAI